MMSNDTIILAGRGQSVYGFDFPSDIPVMAVSSGIFAMQGVETLRHFCALDTPRYLISPISRADIAWANDPRATHWPFWADANIPKHVPTIIARRGHIRPRIPYSVLEKLPEHDRQCIEKVFDEDPSLTGYQPGWMDYPNVHGWEVIPQAPPSFGGSGPIGLWSQAAEDAGFDAVRHSMLFGIQLAAMLGYRTIMFIGCDLHGDRFPVQRATMREWWPQAIDAGMTWLNLAPESALADFLPSAMQEVAA